MPAKFKVGDRVRLTKRCPKWVADKLQKRTRTIIAVRYNKKLRACLYKLGFNRVLDAGPINQFRSYELQRVKGKQPVGRPRQKRKYKRHR
jgi:hypothetical protein